MKEITIDMMLFRPSGKFYTCGEVEIPESMEIYEDNIALKLMELQGQVVFRSLKYYDGWTIWVSEKEESNKFFYRIN